MIRHPVPLRGAFRDRHGRRAGCGGREPALETRALACVRQKRVVLTPRRWRQVRAKERGRRWLSSPDTGESAE
jgi:hypothetical protein